MTLFKLSGIFILFLLILNYIQKTEGVKDKKKEKEKEKKPTDQTIHIGSIPIKIPGEASSKKDEEKETFHKNVQMLFDSAKNNPNQHPQQFPLLKQLPHYYYPQQFPHYGHPNTGTIVYGFPHHLPSPSFHDSIITSVPLDHLLKGEASKQTDQNNDDDEDKTGK
uniref:Candidate secreted effector n=1 Tax=Meloidogyne incognita TaxID=6306 RepID=A0A914KSZ1_MELIC